MLNVRTVSIRRFNAWDWGLNLMDGDCESSGRLWSNYGPAIVSHCSEHALGATRVA